MEEVSPRLNVNHVVLESHFNRNSPNYFSLKRFLPLRKYDTDTVFSVFYLSLLTKLSFSLPPTLFLFFLFSFLSSSLSFSLSLSLQSWFDGVSASHARVKTRQGRKLRAALMWDKNVAATDFVVLRHDTFKKKKKKKTKKERAGWPHMISPGAADWLRLWGDMWCVFSKAWPEHKTLTTFC